MKPSRHMSTARVVSVASLGYALFAVGALSSCEVAPAPVPVPVVAVATARVQPVAMVNGETISAAMIEERLVERAGIEMLDELILETALHQELARTGIVLSHDAVANEEAALRAMLEQSVLGGDPETLILEMRAMRHLGTVRWNAFLWRSAALRALIQNETKVPAGLVEQLHDAQHGERRVVRVIAVQLADDLVDVRAALARGDSFESAATAYSIDPSASRGGLAGVVSRQDPAWPAAFREATFATAIGAISDPVLLSGAVIIIRPESAIAKDDVSIETIRPSLELEALRHTQRAAMESRARALVEGARVTVLDRRLDALLPTTTR
ncbi:MAG: peptidylprolyl isomerase [Planctomycetota bacterium]|nr:peptidylprolyl isomerase [Planctomycetota bacterium]